MTTAHRPTFDPARGQGNSSAPTRQYASRSLPAHKKLKYRQPGQGGAAGTTATTDTLKDELLTAERNDRQQKGLVEDEVKEDENEAPKLIVDADQEARRQRIIEETKELDADDEGEDNGEEAEDDDESDSEDEDETAELMRELAKIKAERAAEKARQDAEQAADDRAKREQEIAFGNPLLNNNNDFSLKRRWDEDVVFRVKEKDESGKKDFVNDMIRSDFHRSFMKKYVR